MEPTPAIGPLGLPQESVLGNYFIAVYPPFSVWEEAKVAEVHHALSAPSSAASIGLYLHIPFCQKKCDYCYYLSFVGTPPNIVEGYLESLETELELYAQRPAVRGRPVSFVYFGGGTPSVLSASQIRLLAEGLQYALSWKSAAEVTFECAPRSIRMDLLEALRAIGVTRLSLGVQSFDNTLLRLNGRIHFTPDIYRAWDLVQKLGFSWVNLDLMTGLLGETDELWAASVREAIRLSPDSVTVYQTEIPHNTQLYRDWASGSLPTELPTWERKRARLDWAFQALNQAGYKIVSAYSAVKDPARHRFQYQECLWRGGDMLGLGVASFSYLSGVHFQNAITLETYTAHLRQGQLPLKRAFRLNPRDQLVRELILQLKWGEVSGASFKQKFGADILETFAEPIQLLAEAGFVETIGPDLRLTARGLLQADRLLPCFYDPAFRQARYT